MSHGFAAWLSMTAVVLFCPVIGRGAAAEDVRDDRPNIILLVADDLGYGDLGCQGSPDLLTPNIDSLAGSGVRFTSAYATAPMCSPSRAGLMTGRYQQRFGHEFNTELTNKSGRGLPLRQRTLADRLKAAGYATGVFGKWHLGAAREFHPLSRGFDEFYGFLGGSRHAREGNIVRGRTEAFESRYITEALTEEAISFIDRNRSRPFFLYLPYSAVHNPLFAPEKYHRRFAHIEDDERRALAAVLLALDESVGAVVKKAQSLRRSALIVFISDNGGRDEVADNGPFRGGKQDLWEGGIRIPMIMKWEGRLPRGRAYSAPVSTMDIFATALAAAGAPEEARRNMDGVDLVPFVKLAKKGVPHPALYWRQGEEHMAVRAGDYKLIVGKFGHALFNVVADPRERHDLSEKHPEVVEQLGLALARWNSKLVKPLWPAPEIESAAGRLRADGE